MGDRTRKIEIKKSINDKGLNITYIKTDKFKTNSINLFIHNELSKETASTNALIPMMLRRGSKDYPTMQDLSIKLQSLYGSSFNFGIVKKGERQILHFYIDSINDKYLQNNERLFDASAEVLNSIISNPLIENGMFKDEYLQQEKENLQKLIQSRINDKIQYAIERCYENMCADERFGISEMGTIKDIEKMDNAGLVKRYSEMVNTARMDVMILGDIDETWIENLGKIIKVETNNSCKIQKEDIYKKVNDPKNVIEEMDVNQGKLSMGFRTNIAPTDSDYYSLMVYSSILGGGVHSKLFQNVREKASLAYYAFARLEKMKGLMMVGSGIEAEKYDQAREIILKQIEDIKKAKISDFEFDTSITTIKNGIRAMSDEPRQMVDYYLGQSILGTDDDFETTIKKISEVKREDIVKVAQKIQLDTVHFIKPRK
jgi:predicted Zn-dependent peptidase